jgi:hypothetical protein
MSKWALTLFEANSDIEGAWLWALARIFMGSRPYFFLQYFSMHRVNKMSQGVLHSCLSNCPNVACFYRKKLLLSGTVFLSQL